MSTDFAHKLVAGQPDKPTILLLHGTGGTETDLIPLGSTLFPGATLLGVRGKVLEHGQARFFRRLAEGVFDMEDLHARTAELADFLPDVCARYGLDPANLVALGFSNGANIAASLLLSRPQALRAAVLVRAMVPFLPQEPGPLQGAPVLLLSGKYDPLVPLDNAGHLAKLLQERGAAVTWHQLEAEHNLTREDVQLAAAWAKEALS